MIQATVAIADFMELLVMAALSVVVWAAGWTLLFVAGLGLCWFALRALFRRLVRPGRS